MGPSRPEFEVATQLPVASWVRIAKKFPISSVHTFCEVWSAGFLGTSQPSISPCSVLNAFSASQWGIGPVCHVSLLVNLPLFFLQKLVSQQCLLCFACRKPLHCITAIEYVLT